VEEIPLVFAPIEQPTLVNATGTGLEKVKNCLIKVYRGPKIVDQKIRWWITVYKTFHLESPFCIQNRVRSGYVC
jgi:hypothetical protein